MIWDIYLTEKLIQIIYSKKQEIKMQQKTDRKFPNGELSMSDNFLLTSDFSQKAFANLSKSKDTIKKENLLHETKKLIQEHIMKQIKANQFSFKKPRNA